MRPSPAWMTPAAVGVRASPPGSKSCATAKLAAVPAAGGEATADAGTSATTSAASSPAIAPCARFPTRIAYPLSRRSSHIRAAKLGLPRRARIRENPDLARRMHESTLMHAPSSSREDRPVGGPLRAGVAGRQQLGLLGRDAERERLEGLLANTPAGGGGGGGRDR